MAREKKSPPSGPNQGYLVSFGDTMTALLAFFIVLNSLAEEQTGANLHAGTGSFVHALKSFGVPGIFSAQLSEQAFQLSETAPLYIVPALDEDEKSRQATGIDETDDRRRIIDYEQEEYQRFLHELEHLNQVTPKPPVDGEVAFDLFTPLGPDGTAISQELMSAARQVAPVLRRNGYEAEIIVWATTPSNTAWLRAIEQAKSVRDALAAYLQIAPEDPRLTASARPWDLPTDRRPAVSLIVRRLKSPGEVD